MEDVEYEFEGNEECDTCGALVGVTDSQPIPAPHENCRCSNTARCNNSYEFSGGSMRTPGSRCFTFFAEITVTCWDGAEIGHTVPVEICEGEGSGNDIENVYRQVAQEAHDLAHECEPCPAPNVA